MSRFRVLFHMVRADFIERVRRYRFLLTMVFSVYLGYPIYAGQINLQLDELQFSTQALIFSAPRVFPRQILASWTAGALLAVITGGGLGLHLLCARDREGLLTWAVGTLFIPALALMLGVCGLFIIRSRLNRIQPILYQFAKWVIPPHVRAKYVLYLSLERPESSFVNSSVLEIV